MKKFETSEAEIVELRELDLKEPLVIAGFVGAGLVGSIAVDHIITHVRIAHEAACWHNAAVLYLRS